jgi:signal peptidase II
VTDSPPSARRKYLLFTIFTIISLVLDQWTKVLARRDLRPRGSYNPKVIIPGGRIWLTILAIGAFVLVLYYLRKTPLENTRLHIALGLVGGGAIGNLVDRMIFGKVTDFIVWKIVLKNDHLWLDKGLHEWPAFNIADAALCIGVGLMLLDMIIAWWAARKAHHAQAPVAKA